MVALPLVFQTTEEWLDSSLGLHPIQVALQVALPELDGGLEPIVFSGRDSRTGNLLPCFFIICCVDFYLLTGSPLFAGHYVHLLCTLVLVVRLDVAYIASVISSLKSCLFWVYTPIFVRVVG